MPADTALVTFLDILDYIYKNSNCTNILLHVSSWDESIEVNHVLEKIHYRSLDIKYWM